MKPLFVFPEEGGLDKRKVTEFPRIPLAGSIDLTWRCNNHCRHCWVWLAPDAPEAADELSLDEIRRVVEEARGMGCRRWSLSGGEPMLRQDFLEIFHYVTSKCVSYTLNTNGTLITPEIARALCKKGVKLVALYGASSRVHDHITRRPGSFDAAMQGISYLREAGAGFTVQLVPMRDNYHEWDQMIRLAETLSPHHRAGAAWLYLSGSRDTGINREILRQRLDPATAVRLDPPSSEPEGPCPEEEVCPGNVQEPDDRLFATCIQKKRDFHIDPYGQVSFCSFIRDPSLRYNLKKGSVEECWDRFIPSLADRVRGGSEYRENCGSCEKRKDCRWCAVYGWLEQGRFPGRVDYLCEMAAESEKYRWGRERTHCRFFEIGGMTIRVESDLPIRADTFHPKFNAFSAAGPGRDTVTLKHCFSLPDLAGKNLGEEVYRRQPWAIYRGNGSWVYLGISPVSGDSTLYRVAEFNADYSRGTIYHPDAETFRKGGLQSLTLFATDQVLLAPLLADREGLILHAAGAVLEGAGLLFAGHSDAGKSTITSLLKGHTEILCDDRMIVRSMDEGLRVFGTWSHGDVPDVSSSQAPLQAILFLEQSFENRLVPLDGAGDIVKRLLNVLVRAHETRDWWEKTMQLVERIGREVPCYRLCFDRSGRVVPLLKEAFRERRHERSGPGEEAGSG